jgi:hypothetical protein
MDAVNPDDDPIMIIQPGLLYEFIASCFRTSKKGWAGPLAGVILKKLQH